VQQTGCYRSHPQNVLVVQRTCCEVVGVKETPDPTLQTPDAQRLAPAESRLSPHVFLDHVDLVRQFALGVNAAVVAVTETRGSWWVRVGVKPGFNDESALARIALCEWILVRGLMVADRVAGGGHFLTLRRRCDAVLYSRTAIGAEEFRIICRMRPARSPDCAHSARFSQRHLRHRHAAFVEGGALAAGELPA